ncbi:hypothetical protein GPECTOR_43g876 [Gonium pectorale]|uniref:Cytosol aminopeptidase domain-containing protein n=1 Tax=Gonium pectorale TaxID=33097 RepID=A0A150GAR2_GONPE|nr:hypothetical protein GPECTOR_43g876 [Gonium pectorale]|eukprot:KXZ46440.1 hypothetical protein GPECTOR_43g876 [Gonium pectorale]
MFGSGTMQPVAGRSAVPLTNVYRTAASVQAPRFGIASIALGDGAGLPAAARRASPRAAPSLRRSVAASAASAMKMPSAVLFEPESLPSVALAPASGLEAWEGELLVLGVTEEDFATEGEVTSVKSEALAALDSKLLGGVVAEIAAAGGFDGKPSLGNAVAVLAKAQKATAVAVSLLSPLPAALLPGALTQITAGALLGGYETTRFKSKKSPTASKLASVHLLVDAEQAAADAAIARGVATAQGNLLTRYLVEAPPNVCTPTHLADTAAHIAGLAPELFELKVYEKEECEAMGMGCYLGVAEASEEPPKFIHLKYTPKGGASRKIAIVGKGLTFDSGGYNLKAGPGSMIEMMKFDMGGAGATLGAARVLAQWQPANVEVHFIIASCENMVAGKGLRPGDILTAANGS